MAAKEERLFRDVSKKLVETEERSRMLAKLLKNNVGLNEDELFILNSDSKFKVLKNKDNILGRKHKELSGIILKYKIKDNDLFGVKLRKRRDWLKGSLEKSLGNRSKECRKLFKEVKEYGRKHRMILRRKYERKVEHLVMKYGKKQKNGWEDMLRDMRNFMGNPRMFVGDDEVRGEEVKDPVIVLDGGMWLRYLMMK